MYAALAGWLSWLEYYTVHQRLWIRFPVKAHICTASSIPGQGAYGGNLSVLLSHIIVFLSLPLPLSLKSLKTISSSKDLYIYKCYTW